MAAGRFRREVPSEVRKLNPEADIRFINFFSAKCIDRNEKSEKSFRDR